MPYNEDLTKINTQKNANIIKIKKRVLFNNDLLKHILSYSGNLYKEICERCSKPLCYSIFLINFNEEIIFYYNLEQCKRKKFCSEECLGEYKETYSNRMCILIIILSSLIFTFIIFILIFMNRDLTPIMFT
jgi:hypothetical protein